MKIALVSMPFHSIHRPNYAIGILKEIIEAKTSTLCDAFNLNILYGNILKKKFGSINNYTMISEVNPSEMLGEFIFSNFVEGNLTRSEIYKYIEEIKEYKSVLGIHKESYKGEELYELIKQYIKLGECFLDKCMETDWSVYKVIGFSVTFQQLMPSLALIKRIKQKHPQIKILLGGNTVHGNMGKSIKMRYEDLIDVVCLGEGEEALVEYIKKIDEEKDTKFLVSKGNTDLNKIPTPNYDNYFEYMNKYMAEELSKSSLTYEFSRGCWWGEKKRCIFCGLNCKSINYRMKNIEKSLSDIENLNKKYGEYCKNKYLITDNIIPYTYYKDLNRFNILNSEFFFEAKSNFTKDSYFKDMKESGFVYVQPGIESLSDNTLKFMNKGVTVLKNLLFLKQCAKFGISPAWNILYGFYNETDDDILNQIDIIKKIKHLTPPIVVTKVRLDRYSTYFEKYKEKLKFKGYLKVYDNIFRNNDIDENLCYYFDYDYFNLDSNIIDELYKQVQIWKINRKKYNKIMIEKNKKYYYYFSDGENEVINELEPIEIDLLKSSTEIISRKKITQVLLKKYDETMIINKLNYLINKGIVIEIDEYLLNIAVDFTKPGDVVNEEM